MSVTLNTDDDSAEIYIRTAAGRTDSESVRLSIPGDAIDALDLETGDRVAVVIRDGRVELVGLRDLYGLDD